MASLKIILLCIASAVVYGTLHDLVTARVCVEYFTIGHTPPFPTDSPTLLALQFGILATWWGGLSLGILAALVSRVGTWPKLNAAYLVRPVIGLLCVMAIASLLEGITGYQLAKVSDLTLPEPFGPRVPKAHHCFFFADSLAHMISYLVGVVGGWILCLRVLIQRRRMSRGIETAQTDHPFVIVSRWTARTISILLLVLVMAFVVCSGVPHPLTASLQENLLGSAALVLLFGVVLAWQWEGVGCLLILSGLVLIAPAAEGLIIKIVLIPWLVTTLLYLVCWWGRYRKPKEAFKALMGDLKSEPSPD